MSERAKKFQVTFSLTGNPNKGYEIHYKRSDNGDIEGLDPNSFKRLMSKAFVTLIERYVDQNLDIDSRIDYYDEVYEDLAERLNYSYNKSITRDSAKWARDHYPAGSIMKISMEDLSRFLEDLDEEDFDDQH